MSVCRLTTTGHLSVTSHFPALRSGRTVDSVATLQWQILAVKGSGFIKVLERLRKLPQCSQAGDPPGYTTPLVIRTLSRSSRKRSKPSRSMPIAEQVWKVTDFPKRSSTTSISWLSRMPSGYCDTRSMMSCPWMAMASVMELGVGCCVSSLSDPDGKARSVLKLTQTQPRHPGCGCQPKGIVPVGCPDFPNGIASGNPEPR